MASSAVTLAALLAVSGCSNSKSSAPQSTVAQNLSLMYNGKFFSVMAPASEHHDVSVGALELCATRALVVTGISAADPHGGLTITSWGSRPNPFAKGGEMLGAEPNPLTKLGFSSGPLKMEAGCGAPAGTNPEFGIQMSRVVNSNDAAFTIGLMVAYTEDGTNHELTVPWTVGYCGAEGAPAPGVTCSSP